MIEAVMFWNEPNNRSHWDFDLDPEWRRYGEMVTLAAQAVAAENPGVLRALGGISPIDPGFIRRMAEQGVLDHLDVVAVHGFPLDWNHWPIDEWPQKLAEIRGATALPVWVSEVGVSSFGSEEVQEFGVRRTAALLAGQAARVHWYSLYDLPRAWPAASRNPEAEGSAYYRHFYMGLLREDGTPKRALEAFAEFIPEIGVCQWFHFEDPRLDDAVRWLRRLGVRRLRTGLSWADSQRPNALAWLDRQMAALRAFDTTITFCYTPEALGVQPHPASPPRCLEKFADFCARMTRRYAGRGADAGARQSSDHPPKSGSPASSDGAARLAWLCGEGDERGPAPATGVIVAHPDDETIGAGSRLPRLRNAVFLHVTDGSPRDPGDAAAAGCATRRDYASARRQEFDAVLALAGIPAARTCELGCVDQEASLDLPGLSSRLAAALQEMEIAMLLTHPYEGGHPDHDATAFAVHAACRLLEQRGLPAPIIIEMTSYHHRDGSMATFEFLPNGDGEETTVRLSPAQREFKRQLIDCYPTQWNTLRQFPIEIERFRPAPRYDFTQAPHAGPLFYELFPWGMTGARFRELAGEAMATLGIAGPL